MPARKIMRVHSRATFIAKQVGECRSRVGISLFASRWFSQKYNAIDNDNKEIYFWRFNFAHEKEILDGSDQPDA